MRRSWIIAIAAVAALGLASCSKEKAATYDVVEVPLSQLSADLAAGKTTSVAVTTAYIARIKANNAIYNAVITIALDAADQAAASDARRKAGKALGALDGIPLLLKDNIGVAGMPTTAGSYALTENVREDSEVARRLRAAGVVFLGKTNLDQWAGMRTVNIFNASTVGGGAHNPYDTAHTACGSSNGSGISASMSFAAGTIGTETGGSVVCPASYMGLVGIKPSITLVSRRGVVPISLTLDTTGPLTRTVTDAAMMLTVMAGSDPGDPWSKDSDSHKTDYAKGLDAGSLKGTKIGYVRGMAGDSDKMTPVFEKAVAVLTAQGAEMVEIPLSNFEDLEQEIRLVSLYDFKEDINAYLAGTPAAVKYRTLADLIAFNKADARENMHSQDIFELSESLVGGRQNPDYIKTLEYAKRKSGPEGIDRVVQTYGVQAFVALTNAPADPIVPDETPQQYYMKELPKGTQLPSGTTYAAMAGYPHVTVPMGLVDGLPVGLSFIGPMWTEQTLLSLAYAYEQAGHARVPPPAIKGTEAR